MSKKIAVITGSPRKNGSSFAMIKIGGCHACETCCKTGKASWVSFFQRLRGVAWTE